MGCIADVPRKYCPYLTDIQYYAHTMLHFILRFHLRSSHLYWPFSCLNTGKIYLVLSVLIISLVLVLSVMYGLFLTFSQYDDDDDGDDDDDDDDEDDDDDDSYPCYETS